jgi:hypothetical protein
MQRRPETRKLQGLAGFLLFKEVQRQSLKSVCNWGYKWGACSYPPVEIPPMPLSDAACRNVKPKDTSFKLADEKGMFLWVNSSGHTFSGRIILLPAGQIFFELYSKYSFFAVTHCRVMSF